jgi:hypothetical protein
VITEGEDEHGHWQQRVYQVRRQKTNTAIGNNVLAKGEDEHGHWQQRVFFVLPPVCASQNLGMFL